MSTTGQWSTQARYFTLTVLMILGAMVLYYIHELIGPLVVSALMAYILDPIVAWVKRKTPLKHKTAVGVVFVLFLALVAVIPATITPVVINQIDYLQLELQDIEQGVEDILMNPLIKDLPFLMSIIENIESMAGDAIHPEAILRSVQAATENVIWLLVIFVTSYYLLLDWNRLRDWIYRLFPVGYTNDLQRLHRSLNKIWKTYLRGQLLSMLLIGIISGIAAAIVGLPGAVIIGLVAAALAVVPSVGSSVMAGVVGVVALFSESTVFPLSQVWFIILVVAVFTGIHLFDNYWLRPKILGQGLHLHPGLILVAVIGGLTLQGAMLALTIVPILSSLEVLGSYLLRRINGLSGFPEEV